MPLYQEKNLLFVRALTPLHVGIGRAYAAHVDLPVQRDEFGYPTIWSSSLKGAIKANIEDKEVRKCFGPYPDEAVMTGYEHSRVAITDSRLLMIPTRLLRGVYAYLTSPHLLSYLSRYLEAVRGKGLSLDQELLGKLSRGTTIVSKKELLDGDRVIVNEVVLRAEVCSDVLDKLELKKVLPEEIYRDALERGLVIVPDDISLNLVNKSLLIEYRVRLKRDTKTVDEGPWSEEYVPSDTLFVSLLLCNAIKQEGSTLRCGLSEVGGYITQHMRIIFIGGRETIGRGLAKLYLRTLGD